MKEKVYALRSIMAGCAGAACALAGAMRQDTPEGAGFMLAALVLLFVSMYYAERHEQVRHGKRIN